MKYVFPEDPFNLEPIWTATLDVYQEFVKICDRHGLRYYVTDGNAIGAVRHGGFIPWDDDLDVSMPRPDYDEFLSHLDELPPHLKFVNWENTAEFPMIYGKIQDTRKVLIDDIEKKTGRMLSNGVFIDVFPIDGYSESRYYSMCDCFVTSAVGCLERFKFTKLQCQTMRGRIAWLLGALLSVVLFKLRSHEDIMRFFDWRARRITFGSSMITARASLGKSLTLFYPKSCWGEGVKIDYNGIKVPIPSDYDSYLKVEYPTYMQLPPESKRHPTHEYAVDMPWKYGPTKEYVVPKANER